MQQRTVLDEMIELLRRLADEDPVEFRKFSAKLISAKRQVEKISSSSTKSP